MPAGAARNALDCAFWDLECQGSPACLPGNSPACPRPKPIATAFTLSLAAPAEMGRAARASAAMPLLKLKLGGGEAEDIARVAAGAGQCAEPPP